MVRIDNNGQIDLPKKFGGCDAAALRGEWFRRPIQTVPIL
jgi:hypothetical protein